MIENEHNVVRLEYKVAWFFAAVVLFILIDAPWIYFVVLKQYQAVWPAGILAFKPLGGVFFYGIYITGLLYFSEFFHAFSGSTEVVKKAFFYGICAYGTYAYTCYAVYDPYPLWLACSECLWGGVISSMVMGFFGWLKSYALAMR